MRLPGRQRRRRRCPWDAPVPVPPHGWAALVRASRRSARRHSL